MSNSGNNSLVARAAAPPTTLDKEKNFISKKFTETNSKKSTNIDLLADSLNGLQIKSGKNVVIRAKNEKRNCEAAISPVDFVQLQSMRSSALARKTNTTSKLSRDCKNLFEDLLALNINDSPLLKNGETKNPIEDPAKKKLEKSTQKIKTNPVISSKKEDKKEEVEKDDEKQDENEDLKSIESLEKEKTDTKTDEKDDALLSRGPVRASRATQNFHPYGGPTASMSYQQDQYITGDVSQYGIAPQSTVYDPSVYTTQVNSYAYECGNNGNNYARGLSSGANYWAMNDGREFVLSNSSTPDTINSDLGYNSATSPLQLHQTYPISEVQDTILSDLQNGHNKLETHQLRQNISSDLNSLCATLKASDLSLLINNKVENSNELPDALSDFILKYSRQYSPSSALNRPHSNDSLGQDDSSGSNSPEGLITSAPLNSSYCRSPLSAGSVPQNSPSEPHASTNPNNVQLAGNTFQANSLIRVDSPRPSKGRLRVLVSSEEMEEAWAWTCKCIQNYPGALCYQDNDRDTLLHIVTQHMDLAKIYSLVEQMLKMEIDENEGKPFDMPNRSNETPLFLAVEKGHRQVVDYLIEAGANPNTQTSRPERDAPLHYAASNGLHNIVEVMCSYPQTDLNMPNGMGLTPLLCAVKNHGVLDEERQKIIDNRYSIQILLKYGADPNITDISNGKSVIHYAVERLQPDLIELFQSNMNEEDISKLVNQIDFCRETPLRVLQNLPNMDTLIRTKICLSLITSGAEQPT